MGDLRYTSSVTSCYYDIFLELDCIGMPNVCVCGVCVYIPIYVCVCVQAYVCLCVYMCMCGCVHTYVCMCMCGVCMCTGILATCPTHISKFIQILFPYEFIYNLSERLHN